MTACDPKRTLAPAPGIALEKGRKSLRLLRNPTPTRRKVYGKSAIRQHSMLAGIPRFPRYHGIIQLWRERYRDSWMPPVRF